MIRQSDLQWFILKKFVERLSLGTFIELSTRGEEWTLEILPAVADQVRTAIEAHPSLKLTHEAITTGSLGVVYYVAFEKAPHIIYGGIDE